MIYSSKINQVYLPSSGGQSSRLSVKPNLRFGDLDPEELEANKVEERALPPSKKTLYASWPFIGRAVLGESALRYKERVPKLDAFQSRFIASPELTSKNLDTMLVLGAVRFQLSPPRPEGIGPCVMHCGYIPPKEPETRKPTVLFSLGAGNDLSLAESFLRQLKERNYPVLMYQWPLLDDKNRHLQTLGLKNHEFQDLLIRDLIFLSKQLESGCGQSFVLPEPRENQILIGHSAGALTILFELARQEAKPCRAALLVSPPSSFAAAINNADEQFTPGILRRILSDTRSTAAIQNVFNTDDIFSSGSLSPALMQTPIVIASGLKDILVRRGAEHVFEKLDMLKGGDRRPSLTAYAHMRNEDHNTVLAASLLGDDKGVRLANVVDQLREQSDPSNLAIPSSEMNLRKIDSKTGRYEGVVRFSGIG